MIHILIVTILFVGNQKFCLFGRKFPNDLYLVCPHHTTGTRNISTSPMTFFFCSYILLTVFFGLVPVPLCNTDCLQNTTYNHWHPDKILFTSERHTKEFLSFGRIISFLFSSSWNSTESSVCLISEILSFGLTEGNGKKFCP